MQKVPQLTMKVFSLITAALASTAAAYTAEEQTAAIKAVTDKGFPPLAALEVGYYLPQPPSSTQC